MRVCFTGCGLEITLAEDDKIRGEKTGRIECFLQEWKKPKLILHIVDKVKSKGFLNEPGFYIKITPRKTSPEYRMQYDLYMTCERFHALTNPKDPLFEGGHFSSRSLFDRVDINYFACKQPNAVKQGQKPFQTQEPSS